MRNACNRYWRIAATGLSFTLFGLGGIVLRLIVFPALELCVRKQAQRNRYARAIIKTSFRCFIEWMRLSGVLRYSITGEQHIQRRGLLILANHPTLIDTIFLMAFVHNADCIVKSGLWRNPFTRGPIRAAGYISNQGGPELIDVCIDSLNNGNNLIIFPEGTRTAPDGDMQFKRGAANIAVRGLIDVSPAIICCAPPTLRKGEKWWHVPAQKPHFHIHFKRDIPVARMIETAENATIAARHLTSHLQHYFMEEAQHHAHT